MLFYRSGRVPHNPACTALRDSRGGDWTEPIRAVEVADTLICPATNLDLVSHCVVSCAAASAVETLLTACPATRRRMLARAVRHTVREAVQRAIDITIADRHAGRTENEPTFSAQLAARLQDGLNQIDVDGYHIYVSIRTVQDRGPGASEKRYGTDLVIVLRIDNLDETVTKGALVQAKNTNSEGIYTRGSQRREMGVTTISPNLRTQCRRMMRLSASSYVWVYDHDNVKCATATSVEAIKPGYKWKGVQSKKLVHFMDELLTCSIGDTRIAAHDDNALERLREEVDSETAMAIEVLSGDTDPAFTNGQAGG